MALTTISALGQGGSGIPDKLPAAVKELQGLTVSNVAGAGANTTIAIAAIRQEDTILSVTSQGAGAIPVDQTSATSIVDINAQGTITLNAVVATNTVTVRGIVYTFTATPNPLTFTDVAVGASDTISAANLAAAINKLESSSGSGALVAATSAAAVVTVRAVASGTAANAYTLAGTATRVTVSAATLAGGAATGGIKITNSTASAFVQVLWFNKT